MHRNGTAVLLFILRALWFQVILILIGKVEKNCIKLFIESFTNSVVKGAFIDMIDTVT